MTSYAPVARSGGGGIQGQQAPAGEHFDDTGGVRTEWWWQDGPVDSCCFCCTLRTGVGILAAMNLVKGVLIMFFMDAMYFPLFEANLNYLQRQYSSECQDHAAPTVDCGELEKTIEQAKASLIQFTTFFFVHGTFNIVAGGVGLWAVSVCNTRAAKAYMLSWPAHIVLAVLTLLLQRSMHKTNSNVEHGGTTGGINWLGAALDILCVAYFSKVSWSYYKRSLDHESAHGGKVSSSAEQAMIAMTTMA